VIWYVAFGGAAGSAARYALSGLMQRSAGTTFPVWTLVVNITGSVLLGFLMRYLADGVVNAEARALLTVGFCGGYTTFSTFSYETVALVEQGDWRRGALYIGLSVVLSLLGALAGVGLARALIVFRQGP
jgi:CrcB protein